MARAPKLPRPTERAVQREIIRDLRKLGLRCVHVPNGAHMAGTDRQRAMQWGAMLGDGAVPGFPDLIVMARRPARVGYIEVKRPGKITETAQTKRQDDCRAALAADGFPVARVQSLDEALATVREWGFV